MLIDVYYQSDVYFFEGFVSVTSMFAYHYSDSCITLAENMIEDRQWINTCEALTNIATYIDKNLNGQLFDMLIDKCIEFGRHI